MRSRLLLTTDAVGGVWTYSLDLARALAEQRDLVVLLAVLGPDPDAEQLTEAAAVPGLQLIRTGLPLDWTASSAEEVRDAAWVLARLAAEAEADLVQLHSPALAVSPFPGPVVSVVHSCVATWWHAVRGGQLPTDLAWRAELVREGLDRSDLVLAPSKAFARDVQQVYDLQAAPKAVHNGRRRFALPATPQSDMVLTAGRLWDEGKNVAIFDAAAARCAADFVAAGPLTGPQGQTLALAHARHLGQLAPARLAELLASRPIFVSPSLYEPFGLAVLEAAQAGCALVLADRPVYRELWGEVALFVDPRSADSLAGAARQLLGEPSLRRRLGEAARMRSDAYSPQAMGSAMLRHYAALAPAAEKVAA
jgi:glycogen synthase